MAGTRENDTDSIRDNSPFESFYSLRLREWCRKIPVARLSPDWERCILESVPSTLRSRHPKSVERTLAEVREIYETEMTNCGIELIVGAASVNVEGSSGTSEATVRSFVYDYRYDVPRQRQLLASKYFLSHTVMRRIMEIASGKLARVALDLRRIVLLNEAASGNFELSTLGEKMAAEIARVSATIKNEYYPEVVRTIAGTIRDDCHSSRGSANNRKNDKKDRENRKRESRQKDKLLRCATNLFTQQIVRMMIRTIDELTERVEDYRLQCPRLEVRLMWRDEDTRLSIDPPIFQIFSMWHSIVRSIENIADDLLTFEESIDGDHRARRMARMKVALPDWYAIEAHRRIDLALVKATAPLKRHFEKMAYEFEPVTSIETRRKIDELISTIGKPEGTLKEDADYRFSIEALNERNERANKIAETLDTFDIGRLDQRNARLRLIDEIAGTRKILVEGMLRRHEDYNEKICQDFENLRDKLLDVPISGKELFKLSEMIAYPSMSLIMEGLESRVTRSVEMLNSLLALTSDMTERHTLLNGATINWLEDIKPVIAKSNTLCEAMKSELEDELQRRISRLNLDIEAIMPKFEILDYMDDPTRVEDYVDYIRELLGHLNHLDCQIHEINHEEKLFKFPETSFPSVEEIREILLPVNNLNNLVREWRRDHAVWLNGPFEYIDATEVRDKTVHHYHEKFERLNASLRTKIKNDLQQSSSSVGASATRRLKLYTGVVDDPDPMQQPAPLTLCAQVLDEVKRFEGHLELIDCVCNPSFRDRHWREISLIYEQSQKTTRDHGDRSASLSSSTAADPSTEREVSGEPAISSPDAGTTLAKLIRLDLAKDIDKYRVISIGANKELALANRLNEMIARWDTVDFSIIPCAGSIVTKTFAQLDEIDTLLEEHEVIIGEMRVSYFVNPIVDDLTKFSRSLTSVSSVVRTWLRVQKEWHDLETVFLRQTFSEQLNHVRDRFYDVSFSVIHVVEQRILREPRFRAIAGQSSELSGLLASAEETLESLRVTVQSFVQAVRELFPRFYFISDLEVIEILFETEYRKKMRLLVRKCFTDMSGVRCRLSTSVDDSDQDNNTLSRATSIIDSCGRQFALIHQLDDEPDCDSISDKDYSLVRSFRSLEKSVGRTVRHAISQGFCSLIERDDLDESLASAHFVSTVTNCPIEVAGVCSWRLYWTSEMERALDHTQASSARKILTLSETKQSRIIEEMLAKLRGDEISRTLRRILVLFIIQIYEQRDVTKLLIKKVAEGGGRIARDDFVWKAQIRHYWREDNVKVGILDTEERYGYEYSGCIEKEPVVRTPLTERCYHSLMEAHRNRLHGLVFGPEAIGKTRSIEALARTLGVDLQTFDCVQRHLDDYHYMDNVFRGLVGRSTSSSSPCWLLFKNLDHIAIRGLSVLAQRIMAISRIIESRCFVAGTITTQRGTVSSQCRHSLPDAIKVFFRPIAFAYPDKKRIVEVLLFAGGFTTAATLAEKLRLFEEYSSQHLSHRLTIGWDSEDDAMRTTKAIVKTACALKSRHPNEAEDTLFLRALVDLYLPRASCPADYTDFQYAMDDLFPNTALPSPNYEHLVSAIRRVIGPTEPLNNERDPYMTAIVKIIQLFELLLVRHVIAVVGASLAGKTTVIDILARSISLLDRKTPAAPPVVDLVRINHDSFTSEELLGHYDKGSAGTEKLCWKDGIFTRVLRSFVNAGNPDKETRKKHWQWILLDGPLYTPLIDGFTTLLDENGKTLFLRSGEKIHIGDSTSFIFETSSTIGASPATISRCGLLYVEDSSTLGWKIRVRRWVDEQKRGCHDLVPRRSPSSTEIRDGKAGNADECATFLQSLLEWSLATCLGFLQQNLSRQWGGLPTNENCLITSVLRLLEIHLADALGCDDDDNHEQVPLAKVSSGLTSGDRRNHQDQEKRQDHMKDLKDKRTKSYITNFFTWSQAALLMSIVWGLGGSRDHTSQAALDEFCKSMWRTNVHFPYDVISLPGEGLIQDNVYMYIGGPNGCGAWRQSSDVIKRQNVAGNDIDYFWSSKANPTSYVPTIDSTRYTSLFEKHVKHRKPFLIAGETATGKTLFMRHLLKTKMARDRYQSNFYTLAGDTSSGVASSARTVQNLFLSRLKKFSKRVYGPSEQARLCVNFIDDMSIVARSKNEAISRELIKQFYEESHPDGCWYDVDSSDRIRLCDVMFLGAIDSGTNWNVTNQINSENFGWLEAARFFRHFNLYTIDRPSDESIFRICSSVLFANLRSNMFNADVSATVTCIVKATIELYTSIVQQLKPIPTKLQYRFSLRDVSRIIDGCSLVHKESAETKVTLMRLWVHEAIRVFADRIVDQTDNAWFFGKLKDTAASHFKDPWETVFDNLPKHTTDEGSEHLTRESFRHLVFSNFMRLPDTPADNVNSGTSDDPTKCRYDDISSSREALKNRAIAYLESYNRQANEKRKLDILMFSQMLEHLLRICRILNIPGASLLMICFGASSGRRSLTALAAYINSQRLEELSSPVIESMMTSGTPLSPWRQDFKRACINCIGESADGNSTIRATNLRIRDCTFFISDREIIGSNRSLDILDDVCSLMKTGRTSGQSLFTTDERDSVVKKCRLLAQRGDRNLEMTSFEVMDYFYHKCQEKLHFLLYFDKSGIARRARQFGEETFVKIVNHCAIDCYENWPDEALHEIGSKFVRDIDVESRARSGIITASKYFWDSVKIVDASSETTNNYRSLASPRTRRLPVSAYIHMIKLYGLSINKRQKETRAAREKYLSGLDKLKSADEEVRNMRSTLTRLRPELELSARETAETMRKIETENVSVEMATVQVKREEEAANEIAEVASILKEECEADLAVAIPILEDAIAALNTLKPTDITLVKAMKNPPDTVKLVLAAVCVMLGVPPDRSTDPVTGKKSMDYWAPSKRILGDMNFLQNLKDYDKDNIPSAIMSVVTKSYMNDESFRPHIVAKASSAAEGLCKWVRAMVSYDEVAKVVAPKKEKLATAERECNAILEYLNEKRRSLAALNDKLAALKESLQATLAKKLQLENEVASCTGKLKRAEALIASLTGEKARWLEAAETLTRTCDNLAGDILLSCGLVALLSPLSAKQRRFYIVDWRHELDRLGLPNSGEAYEFLGSLQSKELHRPRGGTATTENSRHPEHRLSVNSSFNQANASILEHALLWPLILDPQNQANMWIKRVESSNGLVVVKPIDPRWFFQIRECFERDLPVLLENVDRPEYLEKTPIILRYMETSSTSSLFRLYMTSRISFNEASASGRLDEPHDMYKRFSVVNFTLANDALEDRLLEIIVSRERPELRDTFDRLMITSAANRRLLDQEEDQILEVLSGASVNIIEDERALEKLDRWKQLTHEMRMREVETARATEREMMELRTTYRPLTKYCAALYDTLAYLIDFNHMYRFSLDWFIRLYVRSIDTSMRSIILDKRLSYLGSSFTLTLDASVRNALLDEHKLLYSFLLSIKILLDTKKMDQTELRTLLLANAANCKCAEEDNFSPESADESTLGGMKSSKLIIAQQLGSALPRVFQDLSRSFCADSASWESYSNGSNDEALPGPWNVTLTDFQRVILINRLKPEKTLSEVLRLVENTLGWNSITAPSSTRMRDNIMARSYDESSCIVPLIFVLPSYLEAHSLIQKWARTIGYSSKVLRFSMPPSTCQEYVSIENTIARAREHGGWVLLENCHLATDEWLARLEAITESLGNRENSALSFRLWLTSYPSTNFPISILHDGTKIYCQQPSDRVKQSLLDFYATEPLDDPAFYDTRGGGTNARAFSKLVYGLCFFHAIVTGRKRYDDLAWNSAASYEFTDSDLKISIGNLHRIFHDVAQAKDTSVSPGKAMNSRMISDAMENSLESLTYHVSEVYYGGRILDPFDRHCLRVILLDCCNNRLVRSTKNYVFDIGSTSSSDGLEYSAPNRSEYRDFIRHIKDCLPSGEAPPRIFGLDENAAILRDRQSSEHFVHSLAHSLSLIDDDDEVLATQEMSERPGLLDIVRDVRRKLSLASHATDARSWTEDVRKSYPVCYEEPLNSVLVEQVELYERIVATVVYSLARVEETTRDAGRIVESLTRNRVPTSWRNVSGLDMANSIEFSSLSRFVHSLSRRRNFLDTWTKTGHYRGSLWLGGSFRCRRLVLAARQTFARKAGLPLHRLAIHYEITDSTTDGLEPWAFTTIPDNVSQDIVHVHGLYLCGARWDLERYTLVESVPKLYWNPMPMIRLLPRRLDATSVGRCEQPEQNYYSCPVNSAPVANASSNHYFLGSLSTNYVTSVPLESKDSAVDHWIKRRTLLFCNK